MFYSGYACNSPVGYRQCRNVFDIGLEDRPNGLADYLPHRRKKVRAFKIAGYINSEQRILRIK
jgi:hypothetical protein